MVWKNFKKERILRRKNKTNKNLLLKKLKKDIIRFPIKKEIIKKPVLSTKKSRLNLFKITDPFLLKTGIRHSIDRLTGDKIKNSFVERQVLKLQRGLMRFNQNKYDKFKPKKKTKLAPITSELRKIFKSRLKKKEYKHLRQSVKAEKKKFRKFNLFYFKSKGLAGLEKNKKSKWKKKVLLRRNYDFLKKKMVRRVQETARIAANLNIKNLMLGFNKNTVNVFKYVPDNITSNSKQFYNGSLIVDSQEVYLQSKLKSMQEEREFGYNQKLTELKDDLDFSGQKSEYYNNFLKQCFYKNLLFRSFWFSKFISTLVRCGKKQMVWKNILKSFSVIKSEFGKSPVLVLFELLEMYRMPIKALPPKDKTRKVIVRTHLVSWWKQYTQILRWLRHSLTGSVKNHKSWNSRIESEIANLLNMSHSTLIKKKCDANYELAAFGIVSLHFRWHRRFSKRAVNAIKIIDKPLYGRA